MFLGKPPYSKDHAGLLGCMVPFSGCACIPQLLTPAIQSCQLLPPASPQSLPLTFQNSTDYFLLPNSVLSSCFFVASSLPTPNYCHFPVSDIVNQLSIFLQALFVLDFLNLWYNSEPFVGTDLSRFMLTAGFSKLLMPTSIAYTPKVQTLLYWCITSLSFLPAPQCLDFPKSLPSTVA